MKQIVIQDDTTTLTVTDSLTPNMSMAELVLRAWKMWDQSQTTRDALRASERPSPTPPRPNHPPAGENPPETP